MPKYSIKDPQTGKTITVSGAKPPTQEQADNIFKAAGLRSASSSQPSVDKESGVMSKVSGIGKTALKIADLPSQIIGGQLDAFNKKREGTYQTPSKMVQMPGTKKQVDIGKMFNTLFPGFYDAYRGVKDNKSVMQQLPETFGVDPNSGAGLALGFAGEIATPDAGDAIAATKLGKQILNLPGKKVKEFTEGVAERVATSGIKVNPTQGKKFYDAVKKTVGRYVIDEGLAGDVANNVGSAIQKFQGEYDDIALRSMVRVDSKSFGKAVQKAISQLDVDIQEKEIKALKKFAKKLGSSIKNQDGGIDLSDLVKKRRLLDEQIPSNQWARLFAGESVNKLVKQRLLLQELINESVSGVTSSSGLKLSELGQKLKGLYKLDDIIERQSFLGQGTKMFGITDLLAMLGGAGATQGDWKDRLMGAGIALGMNKVASNPRVLGAGSKMTMKAGETSQSIMPALMRVAKELGLQAGQEKQPENKKVGF
jgi:hypothetical protein